MSNSTVPKHPRQFFEDAPVLFLRDLCSDSQEKDAPEGVKQDWEKVYNWLGESGPEFSETSIQKIRLSWKAYIAIGVAPSVDLQRIFEGFATSLPKSEAYPRPPQDILDVFDRLLATDREIAEKRALDAAKEVSRLSGAFKSAQQQSWWRSRSLLFRRWTFSTVVWMILVLIYGLFFDPFDNGWSDMSDEEFTQMTLIFFAPVGAALIYYSYQKWVR